MMDDLRIEDRILEREKERSWKEHVGVLNRKEEKEKKDVTAKLWGRLVEIAANRGLRLSVGGEFKRITCKSGIFSHTTCLRVDTKKHTITYTLPEHKELLVAVAKLYPGYSCIRDEMQNDPSSLTLLLFALPLSGVCVLLSWKVLLPILGQLESSGVLYFPVVGLLLYIPILITTFLLPLISLGFLLFTLGEFLHLTHNYPKGDAHDE